MSANGINIRATRQIQELDPEDYLIVGVEGKEPHKKIKLKDFILLIKSSLEGSSSPTKPGGVGGSANIV